MEEQLKKINNSIVTFGVILSIMLFTIAAYTYANYKEGKEFRESVTQTMSKEIKGLKYR